MHHVALWGGGPPCAQASLLLSRLLSLASLMCASGSSRRGRGQGLLSPISPQEPGFAQFTRLRFLAAILPSASPIQALSSSWCWASLRSSRPGRGSPHSRWDCEGRRGCPRLLSPRVGAPSVSLPPAPLGAPGSQRVQAGGLQLWSQGPRVPLPALHPMCDLRGREVGRWPSAATVVSGQEAWSWHCSAEGWPGLTETTGLVCHLGFPFCVM